MRMWMVDTRILCTKHLLGEHLETHMFFGSLRKGINLQGYCDRNLLEPSAIKNRHDELAQELSIREMNHRTPIEEWEWNEIRHLYLPILIQLQKIDRAQSLKDLLKRCGTCKYNHQVIYGDKKL